MEETARRAGYILSLVLVVSIAVSTMLIVYGYKDIVPYVVALITIMYAIYGFVCSTGRSIALARARVGLKKDQVFEHVDWGIRRRVLAFFKWAFNYRRYRDTPDKDGKCRDGITIVKKDPATS